jgi:predicted RecB family nuclease
MPQAVHVELGHGGRESFDPQDFAAYARKPCQALLAMVATPAETYPLPVSHCNICHKRAECEAQRRGDDHLCQVAGLRGDQTEKLAAAGVPTVAAPAAADVAQLNVPIHALTLTRLQAQARMQVRQRRRGKWPSSAYRILCA